MLKDCSLTFKVGEKYQPQELLTSGAAFFNPHLSLPTNVNQWTYKREILYHYGMQVYMSSHNYSTWPPACVHYVGHSYACVCSNCLLPPRVRYIAGWLLC